MTILKRHKGELRKKFIGRCMSDKTMKREFKKNKQRIAICLRESRRKNGKGKKKGQKKQE